MGLTDRIRASSAAESRVIGGVPWRPWDSPYWKFSQGGPIHPTRAFYGKDEALGLPALYAGARLLADSVASLPVKVYSRQTSDGRAVRYRGPTIFDSPSVTGTPFDWMFTAMTSLVLQGNAWGFITGRDGYGYPANIEWLPPEDVTVVDDEMQPWNPLRTRIYVYGRLMDRQELYHVKAFSLAGRTEGISLLRAFALTILNGMETIRYGTDWYRSGGFPPGTFQNTEIEIDADQSEQIRSILVSSMRRREPLVYGRDWDYKPIVVPPSEAQFIQALQMNATQIASVLGLPPDRIGGTRGDSLTYNTVEQSTLQVIEAMRPWLVRLEYAFFPILPSARYARFDSDAMLKTDLATRTKIYLDQRNMGLRTVDEIRDQEDLEPLPGGAGNEHIPLEVMVAMSRSIRGIPNSMLGQITLEMDLAADRLEKLGQEGLTRPDTGSTAPNPDQLLGQIMGQQRGADGAAAGQILAQPGSAGADERDVRCLLNTFRQYDVALPIELIRALAREYGAHAPGKVNRGRWGQEPEFVGAWIPSQEELVLDRAGWSTRPAVFAVNGSNGHGGG